MARTVTGHRQILQYFQGWQGTCLDIFTYAPPSVSTVDFEDCQPPMWSVAVNENKLKRRLVRGNILPVRFGWRPQGSLIPSMLTYQSSRQTEYSDQRWTGAMSTRTRMVNHELRGSSFRAKFTWSRGILFTSLHEVSGNSSMAAKKMED